jgi:hypothetical protein
MTTPAELSKATDLAERANKLMARAGKSVSNGGAVLDNAEKSLDRFDAHMELVSQRTKSLDSQLATLGNIAEVLDATFPDGGSVPAAPVSAQPHESAALPQVKAGNGAA